MRAGLFGGSFDPPHRGHVALARAAVRELALDRLYVLPARGQPLKPSGPSLSASRRLSLCRAAFKPVRGAVVSPWELRRPGPSFTHRALSSFRKRHPAAQWFLVMGGDSQRTFTKWRRWRDILKVSRLAVGRRAGAPSAAVPPAVRAASVVLKARLPRVSSTEIRRSRRAAST